jgi:DNA polymerase-3 subunit epsilon
MFSRILKRNRPEFWKAYTRNFKEKHPQDVQAVRFVVFDTETTGLDIRKDRILSIGALSIFDLKIDVGDSLELYIKQEVFNAGTVGIHGILKEGSLLKLSEEEAIIAFLGYVKNSVLVAHHAAFDIAMINASLGRMGLPKLKNKVLDTGVLFKKTTQCENKVNRYSLDQLCSIFKLRQHDRHTAAGDAYLTGLIFLKIVSNLSRRGKLKVRDLFFNSDRRGLW